MKTMSSHSLIHVYKASAGAGKTFTLAAVYIANLLNDRLNFGNNVHNNQLAITFTRKATAEMKERIMENLYELAHHPAQANDFLDAVRQRLVRPLSDAEIALAARHLLREILHGYDRFHVTTIDSFFQSLLGNLAHELGLSATFRVDLNNDDVLYKGVDRMLQELSNDSEELQWITQYIERKLEDEPDKSWKVDASLFKLSKELTKESYVTQRGNLGNAPLTNKRVMDYSEKILRTKNASLKVIRDAAEKTDKFIRDTQGYASISRGKDMANFLERAMNNQLKSTDPSDTQRKNAESGENMLTKKNQGDASLLNWAQEVSTYLQAAIESIDKEERTLNSCQLSTKHLNEFRLLEAIGNTVRQLNNENDTFLLANTPILFAELVGDSEASFVFERAGTQFRHVMIDEFQDTSALQWQNLRNLFIENIAQGNSCMLVGDVKQGIYRWRGGDWTALSQMADDAITEIHTLGHNFRTGERIVHFNNALFVRLAEALEQEEREAVQEAEDKQGIQTASALVSGIEQLYAQEFVAQKPVKKEGFVRILWGEKPKDDATFEEEELRQQILRFYHTGVPFDQMGILVRNRKDCPRIINYFHEYELEHRDDPEFLHIPLVSEEAYLLSASRGVQLIIKALQFIDNSTDKVAKAYVMKHCPTERQSQFESLLEEWSKEERRTLPFYDLVQRIISELNIHHLPGQAAYVYMLLDQIVAFLDENVPDVSRFLEYWDETLQYKAIPSSSVKGVKIMTVHKSKGLEFHTVFLPFCNWGFETIDTQKDLVWVTPKEAPYNELPLLPITPTKIASNSIYRDDYLREVYNEHIENLNLLYVAFTRARQNLIVGSCLPTKNKDTSVSEWLNRVLKTLSIPDIPDEEIVFGTEGDCETMEIGKPSLLGLPDKTTVIAPVSVDCAEKMRPQNEARRGNPFKIKDEAEDVSLTQVSGRITFRQSQSGKAFFAGLADELEAERQDTVGKDVGESHEESLFTSQDNFEAGREAARRRGTLLHAIMENIERVEDADAAIAKFVQDGHIASKEEGEMIKQMLHEALKNAQAREWFDGSWTLYRECTILSRQHDAHLLNKRPDRVMMRGDEVVVVDYKFAYRNDAHHDQVREYCQLLREMGKEKVSGYLWYIDKGIIDAVEMEK